MRLIHLLARELSETDPTALLTSGQAYPVWSPFDAFAAADALQKVLNAERTQP